MADRTESPAEAIGADTRIPIADVHFTLYADATVNDVVFAITQMFTGARQIAGELLRTGVVTPGNPIMQHLLSATAGFEQVLVQAQQQAAQQSRITQPHMTIQPRRPQ